MMMGMKFGYGVHIRDVDTREPNILEILIILSVIFSIFSVHSPFRISDLSTKLRRWVELREGS